MARLNLKDATPRERFLIAASVRTSRVIEALQSLGHCSDPARYEYDAEDIAEMFDAISNELLSAQKRFTNAEESGGKERKFTFSAE